METSRIATFFVFADLPREELDALAGVGREVAYDAGFPVVTADDYGTAVYVVEYGEVDVTAEGEGGRDARARGEAFGEAFGEIGLLLTGQRTATVTARMPYGCSSSPARTSSRSARACPRSSGRCAASGSTARRR